MAGLPEKTTWWKLTTDKGEKLDNRKVCQLKDIGLRLSAHGI